MDKIINLMLPHVGEQIFESLDDEELVQCLLVSETWKVLAGNVLFARWKGKLFEACESGKVEVVKILLERMKSADPKLNCFNQRNHEVRTPFMISCENGHKDVVRLLLDHSESKAINLNVRDNYGLNALWLACYNGHEQIVKLLLEHPSSKNIDFNARDYKGETAIMRACFHGYKDIVELLLAHSNGMNIDLNVIDNKGQTALMLACYYGHQEIVELFLAHSHGMNIDLNVRDIKERTAGIDDNEHNHETVFDLVEEEPNVDNERPKIGEHWTINNGQHFLFALVTNDNPLEVQFYQPSIKGNHSLSEAIFEVCLKDFEQKIEAPLVISKGKHRKYYNFL